MGDDADDGGEFFEASMVAFGEDLLVLQVSDAVLDSGAETGDCFVESFLPATSGLIGGFLDRSYRGGRGVSTVSNPCGLCLRKKVTPPTLLDHPGIMTSSWERLGHRHEVAPAGGRDLDVHTLDFTFPGVVRSALPACWAPPGRNVGAVDQQELSLSDRLLHSATGEHQHRLQDLGDPAPDPADRGLGHPEHVSDHHLGYVLTQEHQRDHHLPVEFNLVAAKVESPTLGDVMDTGHDLIDHMSGKTCSRTSNASAASSRDTDSLQHLFSHGAVDALQKGSLQKPK